MTMLCAHYYLAIVVADLIYTNSPVLCIANLRYYSLELNSRRELDGSSTNAFIDLF